MLSALNSRRLRLQALSRSPRPACEKEAGPAYHLSRSRYCAPVLGSPYAFGTRQSAATADSDFSRRNPAPRSPSAGGGSWQSLAEWARQEADFYAAQREGCVVGGFDVSGK